MENGSSSMVSSAKNKNVILIPDSDETSDSNNANNHNMINNNKKRPRHHADSCRDRDDVAFGCGHNNEDTNAASSLLQVDAKFKGVVPQQNGNWGAQIYANHQRVWLGTFKSARQAAMAYDSAAIKLRSGDLHRNFPWTALTLQEPQFQAHYTADAVLAMIKDGSYQSKFEHFVRVRSMASWSKQVVAVDDQVNPNSTRGGPSTLDFGNIRVWAADSSQLATTRKLLFQKELTPSDVGKLNRLVIPKKYAVKYFPFISEENVDDSDDVELVFYDKQLTPWRFRYCYWKSSQSYVFTRGWNRFVKENHLKANDVVTFYSCDCGDVSEGGNISQSFCLIDATANHNHNNNNNHNNGTIESKASLNNEEGKGFRLFGVDIK